eukprot:3380176-Alexandrium_andersonii.AAC.1
MWAASPFRRASAITPRHSLGRRSPCACLSRRHARSFASASWALGVGEISASPTGLATQAWNG